MIFVWTNLMRILFLFLLYLCFLYSIKRNKFQLNRVNLIRVITNKESKIVRRNIIFQVFSYLDSIVTDSTLRSNQISILIRDISVYNYLAQLLLPNDTCLYKTSDLNITFELIVSEITQVILQLKISLSISLGYNIISSLELTDWCI